MHNLDIDDSITEIHSEDIRLKEPFLDTAARFASLPGTVILMSGGELDCAGYHIMGVNPWLCLKGRNRNLTVSWNGKDLSLNSDPFAALGGILDRFNLDHEKGPAPFQAGLMGYLAYDLKDRIEELPRTSVDDLLLPHICLFAHTLILIHDRKEGKTRLHAIRRASEKNDALERAIRKFYQGLSSNPISGKEFSLAFEGFRSNFSRSEYIEAVKRIKEYIASGHVYQVNLSQRFTTDFSGDPFGLFRLLFRMNPAPFFAYMNAGDHWIVSTSPERFLFRKGTLVEARPIKGTRPRGVTATEDERFKEELLKSKKDEAELSMIVDLLRNDLGKVCSPGSVRVKDHKRLEAYENVYHLVSVIEGKMKRECDSVDLLRATFPGGSITGCPKIRSMEIIDELEPERRHAYTGSIGYISFHRTMDLSIAIRTAIIADNRLYFSVGGGIVYDSDPVEEYHETLHKGKTLMQGCKHGGQTATPHPYVWMNGAFRSIRDATISIADLGFQYGYGFFETIRVNHGKPGYLSGHIDRFNRTWKELFGTEVPDLSWGDIVNQVIVGNGLSDRVAALKIIASWGTGHGSPFSHTLVVTAGPYTHRLQGKRDPGLKLALYPEPRQTPLASHKTLNYMYYFLAGKWAKENGADEALIMNPDGSISETNSANILCVKGKRILKPVSPHVLPGVMENVVIVYFRDRGYSVKETKLRVEDLFACDEILLSNSLMGVVPAVALDNRALHSSGSLHQMINESVL